MSRKIHKVIFYGSSSASSEEAVLRTRVEEGLSLLSGLQQPDHPTSMQHAQECSQARERGEAELSDIVLDIATGLGRTIRAQSLGVSFANIRRGRLQESSRTLRFTVFSQGMSTVREISFSKETSLSTLGEVFWTEVLAGTKYIDGKVNEDTED